MEPLQPGSLSDIRNSPAYVLLNDLFLQGKITQVQVDMYKNKYAKLHEVVLETYENEKSLLAKAKELHGQLTAERVKLEEKAQQSTSNSNLIQQLKTDLDKEAIDVANMDERKILLKFELEELDRNREEMIKSLEDKKKRQLELLQPTIDKLNSQINDINGEIATQKDFRKREEEARRSFFYKLEDCKKTMETLESSKARKRQQLLSIKHDPEKMKKQVENLEKIHSSLSNEADKSLNSLNDMDVTLSSLAVNKKEAEDNRMKVNHNLEMIRSFIAKRQSRVDDLKRNISLENDKSSQIVEHFAKLDMDGSSAKLEYRHAVEKSSDLTKLYEEQKKKYERVRRKLDATKEIIVPLEAQFASRTNELETLNNNDKKQGKILAEMKQDVDVFISQYLKQEKRSEETAVELDEVEQRFKNLEDEIKQCQRTESNLLREINTLSIARERLSRDASQATAAYKATKQEVTVKELMIADLMKKLSEVQGRLKNSSAMYEVVKSQRNKYAHLMQSSTQMLAEMKEKIKIFNNEVEILRSEAIGKDRNFSEESRLRTSAQYTRDALRVELNRCSALLMEKKSKVSRQFMDIDKLNSIINSAEKEMIRIRDKYATAVEHRNMTGISLIDRNDELCILNEKFAIQSSIIEKGTKELSLRMEEIRLLELDIADLTWKIDVARKKIPTHTESTELNSRLHKLEGDLAEERFKNEDLCAKLENPQPKDISSRCNALAGQDPDEDQLASKIEVLQERLNEKKEMLLERNLILDEVSSLADHLKSKAAEGRNNTLELAKTMNDYQSKIRKVTTKMMATVSELSMYQATAMKLEQERSDKERELEAAYTYVQEGLPPTADTEHEWLRMERDRQRQHDMMLEKAERDRMDPSLVGSVTRTTADPRPNAYIPDDIGIPKPYGVSLPFKPSQQGSQMRHFRKPDPKPIEL